MRPNTPHYVLTVDNSITLGRHMYCTSTIRDTSWAHIHTGILLFGATNVNHLEVEILLRRVLAMAINDFNNQTEPNGEHISVVMILFNEFRQRMSTSPTVSIPLPCRDSSTSLRSGTSLNSVKRTMYGITSPVYLR
jgi:hypothetical protein